MKKGLKRIVLYVLLVLAVAITLKAINYLPELIQRDTLREYEDVEGIRRELGIKVYVPAYLPAGIKWPPSTIMAQKRPFKAIFMLYRDSVSGGNMLSVHQSETRDFIRYRAFGFKEVTQRAEHDLVGRKALLEVGKCSDGDQCSRISWEEDGAFIKIEMRSGPFDAIRLAESIRPR
ncbi:MAG: hypothetical protein JSV21_10200 [Nitrospirota bacterium]|nr:MAG: hypothetical protein JSV21_10200 [Nitrospirota bacterium]